MKRLVFCFDGSWNRLEALHPTNVVITAESIEPQAKDGTVQSIFYDEGVGTGKWDRIRGGMFGSGLVQNLADGYRFLIFNYSPGDEIFIFGFSRGAYTARSFAGLLSTCGIPLRKYAARVGDAIERYKARRTSREFAENMMRFRSELSPLVCVSAEEESWRRTNMPELQQGATLRIRYLGVWDTVGALGIPARYAWLNWMNRKHEFHDTNLSSFTQSARHAVAIDERRKDFAPTLWSNLSDLNRDDGAPDEAVDSPYQQKWFLGTHGSVGGGGDRRGLSDLALDWILDGARQAGLQLDSSDHSRIFELSPNDSEHLDNSSTEGRVTRFMKKFMAGDREPGPSVLYEVSVSARRRWHRRADELPEGIDYRPKTLMAIKTELDSLDPVALGVRDPSPNSQDPHEMYEVRRGDSLRAIALDKFGDADAASRIFEANRHKLEHPDRIYVGTLLRIPR